MAGEVEVRSLLLKVDASVELLRRNLSEAGATIDNFTKKGENAATRFDGSMKRVNASSGQMRAGFQQLSFQLSDVATQLGSGTGALQVFSQQSGQVIQALSLMTGNAKGFIGFLGGPWGLILTSAITLLLRFKGSSDDAADAQKNVAAETGSAASIMQSTLAGLGDAFDPFIHSANEAIAKLGQFRGVLASALQDEARSLAGDADIGGRLFNRIGRFLPGTLGTPIRVDTGAVARFDKAAANDQAAQARQRALDAQDQHFADVLGRLGFARTTSIGGYVSGLAAPSAARIRSGGGSRGVRAGAAPGGDPLAAILADARNALAGFDFNASPKPRDDIYSKLLERNGIDGTDAIKADLKRRDEAFEFEDRLNAIRQRDEDEYFAQRAENIRTLGGLFTDTFRGGTRAFFRDFKEIGLQVIGELLARFTIANLSGQKFNLGSSLASAAASVGFGGFRAAGGPVGAGRGYVVGERGPELFVPKVPGNIIPNGSGGAPSVSLVVNAPGATAETVSMIRRELANAAPVIIQAAQKTTLSSIQRPRL